MVVWSSSRWASAERPAPGGWAPWVGWSSCCGSPRSTTELAPCADARTLASEICPASSTNRTSTASAMSSRDQSHDVPAATWTVTRLERGQHRRVVLRNDHRVVAQRILGVGHLLDDAERDAGLVRGSSRARRKLPMTLWLCGGHPDPASTAQQAQAQDARPAKRLSRSRRALDGERGPIQAGPESQHGRPDLASPGIRSRAGSPELATRGGGAESAGRAPHGAARPLAFHDPPPSPQPQERFLHHAGPVPIGWDERGGVRLVAGRTEIDGAR